MGPLPDLWPNAGTLLAIKKRASTMKARTIGLIREEVRTI